jgi:hypothetical protein
MANENTSSAANPENPNSDDVLADAREFMQLCITMEGDNHREGLDDLRFLAGEHWPQNEKHKRTLEGRPALTINKLPTFLHQVTNDQRQNRPSIKVHPVDDNADPETARVIQGIVRHSEYASNADVAYDTAVNSAAAIGFGYFRIVTDYTDETSFDQDIVFKRIRNPFTVYFDPASTEPDGSDARKVVITEKMHRNLFASRYPNAQACNMSLVTGSGDRYANWLWQDYVRIAEFYRIEEEEVTLVMLTNGEVGFKEDLLALPEGVTIKAERPSTRRKVVWYKVTAVDVLEKAEIPCRWIPVFPVYGDELDVDGKVLRSGLIRNAKDPSRMYNFWMTAATEEVALRPKTPYIGAEGQFEGHEEAWSLANNASMPYLEYKPVALGGMLAPPPQRQPMADMPIGTLQMAMHANDNIKATTGLFDSSLGARGNATSGKQEIAQQRQGDVANFHYVDNLARTIRHAGRCIIDMIPKLFDTERVVRLLGEDENVTHAAINKPIPPEQQKPDPKTGAIRTVLNDLRVGKYDVTVSTGPSYSTLRQEAADAMIQFGQSWPKLMDLAGDKVVKAMDWPGAEEIAERIERTIPPEIKGEEAEQAELPPEVQAQLQQMQGYIQQLEQAVQQADSGLEKARIDAESRERVAEINAGAKNDVEELKGMIQILLAQMQPPQILTAKALTTGENTPQIRPSDNPAGDQALQGDSLPMGGNTGPEIAQ